MKRTMLTIILSVVALVAAFLAFGFYRSSELRTITLQNEVVIDAPLNEVFDLVGYLENFPRWSPYLLEDPTQEVEVRGVDGKVGASYHWVGRGGKDVGMQKIVKIEEGRYVEMKCDIEKPFVAEPTFAYSFKQTPQGVRVDQVFTLKSGAVDAFFMWLFGAKKDMDNMNKKSLSLLQQAAD